jgi:peptide/nickel transport system substrate-binding protein
MVTRRAFLGHASGGVFAVFLGAACAPPTPAASPSATPATSAAAPAKPAATAAPAAVVAPAGGTLNVDTGAVQVKGLDAEIYAFTLEKNITTLVADPLIVRNRDFQLSPGLATAWKVADDKLTWTLDLRKGVKFHDGTPFNAEAVQVNYGRWTDPKSVNGTLRGTVGPIMESITAPDEYTVQIKTKTPQAAFPALLAGWGVQLVSPTAFKQGGKDGLAAHQVGTGMFRVESFTPGASLTLARNDEYWGTKAQLDKVMFHSVSDPSARAAALLSGQVDMSINLPPSQMPALSANPAVQIAQQIAVSQQFLDMNEGRPPLDKTEVRQAVNYALDMDEIKNVVYEGLLRPFQGPVPPEMFAPNASIQGLAYNPDKAKALMQQAGVSSAKLQLAYVDDPVITRMGQVMQAQLARIGLSLELVRYEQAALVQVFNDGAFDLRIQSNSNASGDPIVQMGNQLHTGGSNNTGHHANAKLDQLLDNAAAELDPARRTSVLNDLYSAYFELAPWAATANAVVPYGLSKRVKGFVSYPSLDLYGLSGVTLSG